MARRARIGDIVEFKAPTGIAYALYTHKHPMFGNLLRVYSRLYEGPLSDPAKGVSNSPTFSTFFPLQEAVDRGIVRLVGSTEVPESLRDFPVFRAAMRDPRTGKVAAWWLWDGTNEWKVGSLAPEHRSLPIREVVNDTLLVERIASGWTAENERD